MENLKEKLIRYMEYKGLKKADIEDYTGVPRSLIGAGKVMSQGISEVTMLRIVTGFPDLNLDWWLRGEGTNMIRNIGPQNNMAREGQADYGNYKELIQVQRELISQLQDKIEYLQSKKKAFSPNPCIDESKLK